MNCRGITEYVPANGRLPLQVYQIFQYIMTPEKKFINQILTELKKTQHGLNDVEEKFFPLRFDKNRPTLFTHKEIAEKLMLPDNITDKTFYSKSIGTTVQNILNVIVGRLEKTYKPRKGEKETNKPAIKGIYAEEMRNDGIDVDSLLNKKPGQKGTWQVAYEWLWNYKYPRWLEANSWQILQEKATSPLDWIKFLTKEEAPSVHIGNKGLILPPPPPSVQKTNPTIPAKQSLWMAINFQVHNHQLLLLNRSQDGQNLLCPSSAYAPSSIIEKPPIVLPQKDSWAGQDDSQTNFKFDLGKEEFLAIALEKPLNLPWLKPRGEEALIVWNGERIKELFEELEKQNNWQVFYQSFDVVESEKNLLPC